MMTRRFNRKAATLALVAAAAVPAAARAQQVDTNPPLPNVLLLLDTSGSMELEIDGTTPESSSANACNCNLTTGNCDWAHSPANANRWGVVQQALTGQLLNGYNCVAMPRSSGSAFATEYSINGNTPYDLNYQYPFHRMVAQDTTATPIVPCVAAPGTLAGAGANQGVGQPKAANNGVTADAFFSGDVVTRQYSQLSSTTSTCKIQQLPGAIDNFTSYMRFGLMTFDNDTGSGIGVSGTSTNLKVLTSNPFGGEWSYFPGWNGVGTAVVPTGLPPGCNTPQPYVVGARNPAAPPWEGRMVGFPTGSTTQATNNSNIEEVVLASRPSGGTPIAGMFAGAQYYLLSDPTGPYATDPYVQGGCRQENIILLTDGVPNEDLRPDCAASGGNCPFKLPEQYAQSLYANTTGSQIVTYVIGFAMPTFTYNGTTTSCGALVNNGTLDSQCTGLSNTDPRYACCELENIAISGGSSHAYFASTPGDLQNALSDILGRIAQQTTTRTVPAYSPVVTNVLASTTTPNQSVFYASFAPSPGRPWSGDVQRSRYYCSTSSSSGSGSSSSSSSAPSGSSTFDPTKGDDFADNLNSSGGFSRTFIAFEPDLANGGTGWDTIRPYIASPAPDGEATFGATQYAGSASQITTNVQPGAIYGINASSSTQGCPYTPNNALGTQYLTPTQCLDEVLDFTFAQPTGSFTAPSNYTFQSRAGNAFGDVYHATPIVVGPPGTLLDDPSYQAFQATWSNNSKCGASGSASSGTTGSPRPTTVYAATNDGLLHAFWADETTLENNEQWAMLLPEAYHNLLASYPSNHMNLLDGAPVVKDVVWDRNASVSTSNTGSAWHTMLVAGYGPQQQGYYAIDVTDPCPPPSGKTTSGTTPTAGPSFRWQLTTVPAGNYPVFAKYSATPAITTLFMNPDNTTARDIGVAILPGGWDGTPTSQPAGGCARSTKKASDYSTAPASSGYFADTSKVRSNVRCWGANGKTTDYVDGRSVAIVRLDTGEIVRVFASSTDYGAYPNDKLVAAKRVTAVPFDSPMTGTPIVYPSDVGADTTKFFVADADGTIWRFDVSSSDPSQWSATLFFDAYNTDVDKATTAWSDGQPLQVPPVVSPDSAGNLVMNFATGTTDQYDTNGTYYVYSVTEKALGSPPALAANVNWYFGPSSTPNGLRAGERVSGPMTVFNGSLYFSTFYAGTSTSSCASGDARIWGMDYVTPYNKTTCTSATGCGNGGSYTLTGGFVDVGTTYPGRVVPGVAVQATPACASFGSSQDLYVGNTSHQVTNGFTAGTFSLVGLVGGVAGANGLNANPFSISLPTPTTPTLIDSWAAVLE